MENVIAALRDLRIGKIIDEYELQQKIANVFDNADISYEKEKYLGKGNRVDFLTAAGIAVEVKKGKPNRNRLEAQINRYAEFNQVSAVVIVLETSLRDPVKRAWNGKPCEIVALQKLWGIAL